MKNERKIVYFALQNRNNPANAILGRVLRVFKKFGTNRHSFFDFKKTACHIFTLVTDFKYEIIRFSKFCIPNMIFLCFFRFHHLSMLLVSNILSTEEESIGRAFVFLNTIVHSIMYTYFGFMVKLLI